MTRLTPGNWRTRAWVALVLELIALLLTATAAFSQRRPAAQVVRPPIVLDPTFFVKSYLGKCLDFGPPPQKSGSPVFVFGCNETIAQKIRIQEINERHDVILRAGTKVIGVRFDWVIGPVDGEESPSAVELPVELQDERDLNTVASRGQIFALDGDSIILAANRKLVMKVKNSRGVDRTPLVLGQRDLADAEFWTFTAADRTNRRPTSGFISVTSDDPNQFETQVENATPGTVFELDPFLALTLTNRYVTIPAGVTIRGDRRGTRLGPVLQAATTSSNPNLTMLEIVGSDVRITGLRLLGPSRSTDSDADEARAIFSGDRLIEEAIIDHNDMSEWPLGAVDIRGGDKSADCGPNDSNAGSPQENVRVVRNFIHHNQKQGEGYGVVTKDGGISLIDGNTFVSNRHAIAGGGQARTIYRALYNLVLTSAPQQRKLFVARWHTHDFDMHGTGNHWYYLDGFGGTGGQYIQIERNTFLGRNRNNFKLRGEPCYLAEFLHNVSLLPRWNAVECTLCDDESKLISNASLNLYESEDPTRQLRVGDFDGDGTDDVFLATGAAWYYAPQGIAAWRFINAQTDPIETLRFGDFDGDRRTDVFTQRGRDWLVSWGGLSQWEKINESREGLNDFFVGDFLGDHRADVFYADGRQWWVSDGGITPFVVTAVSGYRVSDLGFGDFNGDGKLDVVGSTGGKWAASLSASGAWSDFPLRSALTNTIKGLFVADFNGNGIADIASSDLRKVSYDGRNNWVSMPSRPGDFAAIGRFDQSVGADILFFWDEYHYLGIRSAGVGSAQRHSSQNMK